jgi:hypothetical protein
MTATLAGSTCSGLYCYGNFRNTPTPWIISGGGGLSISDTTGWQAINAVTEIEMADNIINAWAFMNSHHVGDIVITIFVLIFVVAMLLRLSRRMQQ